MTRESASGQMSDKRLLTVKQVAEQFGVRSETVLRWIKTGRINGVMPGGTRVGYRIPDSEVRRLL
jgi:excisionase family DNA binding protein